MKRREGKMERGGKERKMEGEKQSEGKREKTQRGKEESKQRKRGGIRVIIIKQDVIWRKQ